eukprot:1194835-Prorocentrum_minimum.AAC.8
MVALSDVVAAEQLVLDPALAIQIKKETSRLRSSGSKSINTWKQQHNVRSSLTMTGGGGVRTINAAVPTKDDVKVKAGKARPASAPPKQLQLAAMLAPSPEVYNAGKYSVTEGKWPNYWLKKVTVVSPMATDHNEANPPISIHSDILTLTI